jgi:hypothetical protein
MVKLKLKLEDLQIDSFSTTTPEKNKGTVFGEQCTCWTQCGQNTCPGCPTCDASCNGTCGASCNTCGASCGGTCDNTCVDCGTWDISCGGYSCDPTCAGWATYPDRGHMCVECVG